MGVSRPYSASDANLMRECFQLAALGEGSVSPNPMVGALLVKNRKIVGRGYHKKFGGPHAEVFCIRQAGKRARGATLYVNLEPCSYHGKTPPCVDLVIQSGIRRVVVAMVDPNPRVSGAGIRRLRAAGIDVRVGLLKDEAELLNRTFIHNMKTARPYVHLKVAQSLDGLIAPAGPSPRYLTGNESRRLVHLMRASYDAVLVGAGTIRADDPRLDVRLVSGRNPSVVVLDGNLNAPLSARVFSTARRRDVYVCVSQRVAQRKSGAVRALESKGVKVLKFEGAGGKLPLRTVLRELYNHGIGSILAEGGEQVFSSFVRDRMVQEMSIFIAPRLLGSGTPAFDSSVHERTNLLGSGRKTVVQIGDDILVHCLF